MILSAAALLLCACGSEIPPETGEKTEISEIMGIPAEIEILLEPETPVEAEKPEEPVPVDFIDDIPLFIEYVSYKPERNDTNIIKEFPGSAEGYIRITYEGWLDDLRIIGVSTHDRGFNFEYEELIFGFGSIGHYRTVYYAVDLIKSSTPEIAVALTGSSGEFRYYILWYDWENDRHFAAKEDIQNRPADEYITNAEETVSVNLYFYDEIISTDYYDEENFFYVTVNIAAEDFLSEAKKALYLHKKVSIDDLRYENGRLTVDFNSAERQRFDAGSMAGIVRKNTLLKTFAGFPGVSEVEFLIGGERNAEGNHFNFNGYFTINGILLEDMEFIKNY